MGGILSRILECMTLKAFCLAEALEYITAFKRSTPGNPVRIRGQIGPTEQLPLVARIVNELALSVKSLHSWGMNGLLRQGSFTRSSVIV